ncbi:MAG: gamma-glutamylcyclotransferase family protein [Pirellulales bacterium]
MPESTTHAFFVYGTLKRGYLREHVWPHTPNHIETAWIEADLYDLGPYPAIHAGSGKVAGELWTFDPAHMQATLGALDEAEGFGQLNEPNYYERRTVSAHTADGRTVDAFAYFMCNGDRLSKARRIPNNTTCLGVHCASWPDSLSRVPKSFAEEKTLE